jgi:hypothetical protein
MVYIIEIELERSVGEILYDFNTENVDVKLSETEGQANFRRIEIRRRKIKIFTFVISQSIIFLIIGA